MDEMTPTQVARELGVHYNTVRNWSKSGILTPCRRLPSGHPRYDRADVERLRRKMKE